jgi:uncharacterized protein YjiS (DUF1127 family)
MITSNLEAQLHARNTPRARPAAMAALMVEGIAGLWRAFQNRRSVKRLLEWDSRMLQDIGVTRGDVVAAMSGSIKEDPGYRLSVLAVERRAASRAASQERLNAAGRLIISPRGNFREARVKVLEI